MNSKDNSTTLNQSAANVSDSESKETQIRIPKLGWVKLTESLRFEGKIQSATVSRTADKWFVSLHVQMETTPAKVSQNQADVVGVDLKSVKFHARTTPSESYASMINGPF